MNFPIGKMTVGDILDRGIKLLFARLPAFYLINLLVLAPVILFQVALPLVLTEAVDPQTAAIGVGLSSLGVLLLVVILAPIATAATLHLVMQEFVGRRPTIGEALRTAMARFGPLLGTSILVGLVVGLGFVLCIPGFYFLVSYAFVGQVVVLEELAGGEAMTRSKNLVSGYFWRVFGIIILVTIASTVVQGLIATGLAVALPSQKMIPVAGGGMRMELVPLNHVVDTVVTQLVSIVFTTFQAVCTTLLYLDLRIRKEGFDLELAARGDAPADDDALRPGEPL